MKEIPLTQGKCALVDDEDYDFISQWKWWVHLNRHTSYAVRRVGGRSESKTIWMHRLILKSPDQLLVDHIDGNGLNNQKSNLRFASQAQNLRNTGKRSAYKKYKGTSLKRDRWEARICFNNQKFYLGSFESEEEAAEAYDKAAMDFFGEFAYLNFPLTS